MACSADVAFVFLSINPIGGLAVSIPFGVLGLHYKPWLAVAAGVPLGYVQVLAVDLLWTVLVQWSWWTRMIERRRNRTVERLVAGRGAFALTAVLAPVIGPWLVMAFMRYAQVPQRRVAAPILLGVTGAASVIAALCTYAPRLVAH